MFMYIVLCGVLYFADIILKVYTNLLLCIRMSKVLDFALILMFYFSYLLLLFSLSMYYITSLPHGVLN